MNYVIFITLFFEEKKVKPNCIVICKKEIVVVIQIDSVLCLIAVIRYVLHVVQTEFIDYFRLNSVLNVVKHVKSSLISQVVLYQMRYKKSSEVLFER